MDSLLFFADDTKAAPKMNWREPTAMRMTPRWVQNMDSFVTLEFIWHEPTAMRMTPRWIQKVNSLLFTQQRWFKR